MCAGSSQHDPAMPTPQSVLRALRATVLEHRHHAHPDLAELARQLGRIVHHRGASLERHLHRHARRLRGAARWRLTPRRSDRTLLLCAWPPGHLTPVHDHGDAWGLELVVRGALEVQQYQADGKALCEDGHTWLGQGDALWFDRDERYLHRARNLSAAHAAWTLHVYGGPAPRLGGEPGNRAAPIPDGTRPLLNCT
jgi:predicted metal-dependent enzyme (double-stranded beta helix superfamily)